MERKEIRILVVDDEPMMTDSLKQNLAEEGYTVDTASNGAQAVELFDGSGHHLVVCDLQLPDKEMNGMDVLKHVHDTHPATEVIVMTGYGTVERAVEATKAGAFWFLEKPFDFEVLLPLVEKALERRDLVEQTTTMRQRLATRTEYFNIIGSSKEMQTIYETIESVAKSDANVLIVGESGTGKELIANAIHYNSLRAKKP
ncbi:MAG TPA: response regulator, partial [Pyrinomonadaceae bacterium]